MKLVLSLLATMAMGAMGLLGASWTGTISDSMCGASHGSNPAKQCTLGCVKKGAKYVVVVGDKVYSVANQDAPGLMKYAGESVKVTGKLSGDTITVKKISKT
ncbi:MAG TPA: hypothetical protein VME17_11130 [Bryobacteraceae bacterium]|nr:hypothetical protein [Bryobacteraceae bacterium]